MINTDGSIGEEVAHRAVEGERYVERCKVREREHDIQRCKPGVLGKNNDTIRGIWL